MENASKALIIAGAIILAILIIGLGMSIFNQARDTVSQANLDQETVTALNSKYEQYMGDAVKGVNVKALLALVRDNNLSTDNSNTYTIKVTSDVKSGMNDVIDATKINELRNAVKSGNTYKVVFDYGDGKTKKVRVGSDDIIIPAGLLYSVTIKK